MSAGFSLRKIKTPQTLGTRLRRARKRQGVTISEAEMETKIRGKYIDALERGNLMGLPADTYAKGFVTRYSKYLGLDPERAYKQYMNEKNRFAKESNEMILPKKKVSEARFVITPKLLAPIAVGVLVLGVISYIIFQVYGFAAAPELVVTSPDNNSITENETIEIRGVTGEDAKLFINSQPVQVSSDGKFATEYKLQRGINVIEVKSLNKADKEKSQVYTVEYKPKTAQSQTEVPAE
jgi:cytoskeletal protein RodZ